ncbi:putative elongation factor 1-gamma (EF-1-gamma) [Trypanosoma cruzi]|nr:putative elongation factor 1-gamma (EF-1-gamma) [Trypanosoma cruzi]
MDLSCSATWMALLLREHFCVCCAVDFSFSPMAPPLCVGDWGSGEVRGTERGWLPTTPRALGSSTHTWLLSAASCSARPWTERMGGVLQPQGQRDAVRDGEADPRVVTAHGARARVRVERCAHGWGEVAARHCGAVCVVCGGGMAAIVREVADTELLDWGRRWRTLRRSGSAWRLRVLRGPDDPEACAGGVRAGVSVACL